MAALDALLASPNLDASEAAYGDLVSGLVDHRLVGLLAVLVVDHRPQVQMIKTGHPMGPLSPAGRENRHYFYRAADIYAVDDQPVSGRPISAAVVEVGQWLMALPTGSRAARIMGPAAWHGALPAGDRTGFRNDDFANRVHHDHLHLAVAAPDL